ncbi:hypothetical protein AURDEDRAFT_171289 [Auricularia subglabra TFB-10046 SS5]|nr:hypothetical protein AURDEDRAFT_171289 [Auricularia subglabra TFB-10046 SS5]
MASLSCTWTAFLWECERALPDEVCLKGYNIYESDIQLEGCSLPVWIAHHETRRKRRRSGTLARIVGMPNVYDRCMLIVATIVVPATLGPLPGVTPVYFHLLPRFVCTGIVVSEPKTHTLNANCFSFDIAIFRPDIFPVADLFLTCWANRDVDRLNVTERPTVGSSLIMSGVFCGWSVRNAIMMDVHTLEPNYTGPASPRMITATANPFEQAVFDGNIPEFPTSSSERFVNVFSRHAPPTRITRQYGVTADPRLQPRADGKGTIPPIRIPPLRQAFARRPREDAMHEDSGARAGGTEWAASATDTASATEPSALVDTDSGSAGCTAPGAGDFSDAEMADDTESAVGDRAVYDDDDTRSPVADAAGDDSRGGDGTPEMEWTSVASSAMATGSASDDTALATTADAEGGSDDDLATRGDKSRPDTDVLAAPGASSGAVTVQDLRDLYDGLPVRGRRVAKQTETARAVARKRIKIEPSVPSLAVA